MKEITDAIAALESCDTDKTGCSEYMDQMAVREALANLIALRDAVTLIDPIALKIGTLNLEERLKHVPRNGVDGGAIMEIDHAYDQVAKAARLLADAVKETKE